MEGGKEGRWEGEVSLTFSVGGQDFVIDNFPASPCYVAYYRWANTVRTGYRWLAYCPSQQMYIT